MANGPGRLGASTLLAEDLRSSDVASGYGAATAAFAGLRAGLEAGALAADAAAALGEAGSGWVMRSYHRYTYVHSTQYTQRRLYIIHSKCMSVHAYMYTIVSCTRSGSAA